ncbi:MAG: VOC family protein [Bacteroidaceae bacterium]|nr:VOC family protein [Bacteroidaceae bacterium]
MIKDIAHIALNPLNMDKTIEYFDNVFGWKKVFELHHDNGDPKRVEHFYPGGSWTIIDSEQMLGVNLNVKPAM